MPSIFTDQTATTTGTALSAANLNTAVPASPYVLNGTTYYPSSFSGASLSLTQPAVQAVVNNGSGGVVYVSAASTTLAVPSNPTGTWYVDLTASGSFTVTQSGSAASNALRLYQVTSTGTGITALFTIANVQAVPQTMVVGDLAEAATNDTIAFGVTSVQNNLNRIRYWMGQLGLGSWNALIAAIPLSQKGAASGVSALDSVKRLIDVSAGTNGVSNGAAASPAGTVTIPTTGIGLGTGGSASLVAGSTDRQGQIHLTIGTSPTANNLIITVQYGAAYPNGSRVALVPAWSGSGSNPSLFLQPVVVSATSTGFSLFTAGAAMGASATYWIDYVVNGY